MNKVQNLFSRKLPVIFFIVFSIVAALIVFGVSVAIAAGETYQLTVRCDEGVEPT